MLAAILQRASERGEIDGKKLIPAVETLLRDLFRYYVMMNLSAPPPALRQDVGRRDPPAARPQRAEVQKVYVKPRRPLTYESRSMNGLSSRPPSFADADGTGQTPVRGVN